MLLIFPPFPVRHPGADHGKLSEVMRVDTILVQSYEFRKMTTNSTAEGTISPGALKNGHIKTSCKLDATSSSWESVTKKTQHVKLWLYPQGPHDLDPRTIYVHPPRTAHRFLLLHSEPAVSSSVLTSNLQNRSTNCTPQLLPISEVCEWLHGLFSLNTIMKFFL